MYGAYQHWALGSIRRLSRKFARVVFVCLTASLRVTNQGLNIHSFRLGYTCACTIMSCSRPKSQLRTETIQRVSVPHASSSDSSDVLVVGTST